MKVVQCRLRKEETSLVTWLPADAKLKVGMRVELVGVDGIWDVETVGEMPQEKADVDSHRVKSFLRSDFVKDKDGGYRNVK